ncbi:hypothetical protein [Kordiimonas aestuarii]|uniref:hypothetical protein n=1 Tax=Kordiimonas aestuarii TaxID=1005925 RepID=UPI0021CF48E3|nr:hypothetical protein [Kordiimonas aestuarii]
MSFLELPGTITLAAMTVKPHQRTKSGQAMSGKILTSEYGGHFFEMTLVYPPMLRAQAAELIAFLHAMRGRGGIFDVPLDNLTGVSGVAVGNFARFDNDSKIHVITSTSPLTVSPPARVPGGTLVTTGLKMRCSLASDVQEIRLNAQGLIRLEIDVIERV